jgi:hypothetical protein
MGWLVSRSPVFAAVCGTVGFGAAASSLLVARRALVPAEALDALLAPPRVPVRRP